MGISPNDLTEHVAASRWELLEATVNAAPWPVRITDLAGQEILTNRAYDRLVASHTGALQAASRESRQLVLRDGSCFTAEYFTPPLGEAQFAIEEWEESSGESGVSQSLLSLIPGARQPASVLVVDDDDDHRRLLARLLERAGYTTTEASSARDALRLLEVDHFDALVSDISMPGMDGVNLVTALRQLESDQRRPRTPVLIVTAHNIDQFQNRAARAGVDAFLAKPIRARQVCSAVSKILHEPPKVLVVDDHAESRLIVERYLTDMATPVTVQTADSGKAALELCANQQFALITLDVVMPELDGVQTARILRALPGYEKVPIIACSARLGEREVSALEKAGCNATLNKPLDKAQLQQTVEPFLLVPQTGRAHRQTLPPSRPKHVVAVPADIYDLVPIFLENRRKDASTLRQLAWEKRFEEVARLAHNMIGTGSAYGFPFITELGSRMETCAEEDDQEGIVELCGTLTEYLSSVEAVGGE